jgi:hypothetical protein
MRYNDNGIFKIRQEILQPHNSLSIKVVGRLIQNQNIRISIKSLCQQYPYFLVGIQFFHQFEMFRFGYTQLLNIVAASLSAFQPPISSNNSFKTPTLTPSSSPNLLFDRFHPTLFWYCTTTHVPS